MNKQELDKILKAHKLWLEGKGGEWADLQRADLQGADLQEADLQGANIDFSCWPLWCGSKNVKVDRKIALQLLAHFCVLDCEDAEIKKIQKSMMKYAKQCHRADELGLK